MVNYLLRPAALALALATLTAPALAQTGANPAPIREPGAPRLVAPGTAPGATVVPGGQDNGGPGSGGTIAPTGSGEATITTDPGASSNAGQPERAVPQTGSGSGGDSGSGG